jgi:RND superfamily putative drug exporter
LLAGTGIDLEGPPRQSSRGTEGSSDQAQKKIDPIEARVAVSAARLGLFVGEAGAASSGKALDKMFGDQLTAGERSIPITIAVLLLVFGALVAVGVPPCRAVRRHGGGRAVALPSQFVPMDQNVNAVILLSGLAVGVDYSLFYIKRERESRRPTQQPRRDRGRRSDVEPPVLISASR